MATLYLKINTEQNAFLTALPKSVCFGPTVFGQGLFKMESKQISPTICLIITYWRDLLIFNSTTFSTIHVHSVQLRPSIYLSWVLAGKVGLTG